jgi:hypothetical protein
VAIMDRAFSLIESASRADQRSQGYRTLLETLSVAPFRATDRFAATLGWLEGRAATTVPDLRRSFEKLIRQSAGPRESIEQALAKSAKPRRDPRTYVGPTRQRGSKRKNRTR